MDTTPPTRRDFIATGAGLLGSGWIWLHLPALAALAACARDDAAPDAPFLILSTDDAATMRALAARILPSDERLPGADEAGVVGFVDRAVSGPLAELREPLLAGLADIDRRARDGHGAAFAALEPVRQDALIAAIENTPFFEVARLLTIAGVFADPAYGGNRDGAGWAILDVRHAPSYQPPFGWYDAPRAAGGAA